MKLSNLSILSILSLTSSTAYASPSGSCYNVQGPAGNPTLAMAQIEDLCKNWKGPTTPKSLSYGCRPVGSVYYEIASGNKGDVEAIANKDACREIYKAALACPKGGDFVDGTWRVIVVVKDTPCN
ncbi:hypothetical protein DSL72_003921 [Monilinia vaccinii-corymbosi]|uniref:Ecp2 effector protein domain-containing protein n=1 Tax=Monilinia vaccinii-corymbosi TaxID=61207 RepID=A0A8A3P9G5_9HELO|nr:hypothetical protein DSL72_003921 [Monilinia vaccinii-corymbosi]